MNKGRMLWWLAEWIAAWQSGVMRKSFLASRNSFLTRMCPIQPAGSRLCARSQPQVVWAFSCNLSKCFLICHRLCLLLVWAAHPLAVIICFWTCRFSCLSSRPTLLHLPKMNNQHFEKTFFAPKMSLLWVYFSLPIQQMLPALRGIFCTSQSLWLGGLPDAQALCRAAHECQGGEQICLSDGKGNQSVAENGGTGGGCCFKMEKCKQVWNRCRQVPTAVEAAWCSRKSIGFGIKPTRIEIPNVPLSASISWTLLHVIDFNTHNIQFLYGLNTPWVFK